LKGGREMPIYSYECQDCGREFEIFSKTFEVNETLCPACGSKETKRRVGLPLIRSGRISESISEFSMKDDSIEYYKKKGRFDLAAKEAEKAGKSEWEIKRIREGKKF
jgi:putative FmdB family regulatory protein